jgi:hypothetical protein
MQKTIPNGSTKPIVVGSTNGMTTNVTVGALSRMMSLAKPGVFVKTIAAWPSPLDDDPNKREQTLPDIERINRLAKKRGVTTARLLELADKASPYAREYGAYVAALIYSDWADGEPPTPKELA